MRKAFIQEGENTVDCAVYEGNEIERFYHFSQDIYTGSIAVGKVKFVKKGVGVFVDIGLARDGLLPYRPDIKSGDTLLVRIETEPQEGRGCSLTEKINLVGKYVVLLGSEEYKFSSEITQEKKNELFTLPRRNGVGYLFRSLAKDAPLVKIQEEAEALYLLYTKLFDRAKTTTKPTFLYREDALTKAKNMAEEVTFSFPAFVKKDIEELSCKRVTKEGVELVFDKTEAMTVVDVNFHRSEERGNTAVYTADCIAVKEFARQLRLRNIGGIIILDYISLVRKEERDSLFAFMQEELKKDFVRCEIEHAERTGLFIVTRPKR